MTFCEVIQGHFYIFVHYSSRALVLSRAGASLNIGRGARLILSRLRRNARSVRSSLDESLTGDGSLNRAVPGAIVCDVNDNEREAVPFG